MKNLFEKKGMRTSVKIIAVLGLITLLISFLPDVCLAQGLVGRCITFMDQWEILLTVLASILIATVLCQGMPPELRRIAVITGSVFVFLVTQATIAEYGKKFSLIFFPALVVVSFALFVRWVFMFMTAPFRTIKVPGKLGEPGAPGAAPSAAPQKEKAKRGFFRTLIWLIRIIVTLGVFLFVTTRVDPRIGLVAAVAAFIVIIYIEKLVKNVIQQIFLYGFALIVIILIIGYSAWHMNYPDGIDVLPDVVNDKIFPVVKKHLGDPLAGIINNLMKEAAEGKGALEEETIGGVKYKRLEGSTADARVQAQKLVEAGRATTDEAVKQQIKNRLNKLYEVFPAAKG